jgi:hypothetical protein
VLLGRVAGGWWHVRRLRATGPRAAESCRRLAYRLGLPAAAHVVESALVDVPTAVGWLRPAILLPIAALASLTPAQVEAILAHELAHIRRHDYALNVLQTIAETLLFYHPAIWWVSNRIRAEREHCCDEIAVAVCGDPISYARALAELESLRTIPTAMALAATGGSLLDRVRRILRVPIPEEPRSRSWAVTLALTLVFTAGAGSVQHLPWSIASGDARAAAPLPQQSATDPSSNPEDRMRADQQDARARQAQARERERDARALEAEQRAIEAEARRLERDGRAFERLMRGFDGPQRSAAGTAGVGGRSHRHRRSRPASATARASAATGASTATGTAVCGSLVGCAGATGTASTTGTTCSTDGADATDAAATADAAGAAIT